MEYVSLTDYMASLEKSEKKERMFLHWIRLVGLDAASEEVFDLVMLDILGHTQPIKMPGDKLAIKGQVELWSRVVNFLHGSVELNRVEGPNGLYITGWYIANNKVSDIIAEQVTIGERPLGSTPMNEMRNIVREEQRSVKAACLFIIKKFISEYARVKV